MKRFLIIVILINLHGCTQLQKGQMQPVLPKDLKQDIWMTNCGGAVEVWNSCYNKAQITCKNGYTVISHSENATGTVRELIFQCKK